MGTNLKLFWSILLLIVCSPIAIIAQTVGPNSAGTGTNVNVTGIAWSNPGNITASDNNRASVSLNNGEISDALVATNFGFTIPATATIDGVTVSIEKSGTRTTFFGFPIRYINDNSIQLTIDGTTPIGDNKASATAWPSSDTPTQYGGATDAWNASLTPTDVNSSNFGVYIQASCIFWPGGPETGYIDHVTVTIDYSIPTPVELISFDGAIIDEVIELKWRTTWEVNNDFFTIEKSSNGLNYLKMATINGNGSTELISEYTYIDPLPVEENNYYRLSQTDFDGTTEVFKPIMISYDGESPDMKIYPNPVQDDYVNLTINQDFLKGENNNNYIIVRNITGELVYQQSIPTNTLGEKISLNKKLESGVYILELHSAYGSSTEKLIVK